MTRRKKTGTSRVARRKEPSLWQRYRPQAMAIACAMGALLVALALYSYHSGDPSWNVTGDAQARNAIGATGSVMADLLLQSFGVVAWLIPACLLGWAWRFVLNDVSPRTMLWRVLALTICMFALSTFIAVLAASSESARLHNATGAVGIIIGMGFVPIVGHIGTMIIAAAIIIFTLPLALGVRLHEWIAVSVIVKAVLARTIESLKHVVSLIRFPEARPRETVIEEAGRAHDLIDERYFEEDEEEIEQPPEPVSRVERKAKPKREQTSLELRTRSGNYTIPSVNLLQKVASKKGKQLSESALEQNARLLESVLMDFGVKGEIVKVRPGPVVTLYELEPAPGIKSSRVIGLADDIARSMSAISARIAVIPGRNAIGIELPNNNRETVYMRQLVEDNVYEECEHQLPVILGKDIGGEPIIADLARMPHLLVAGTTGSGKSVAINTMLMSLIYKLTPDQCKLILIDPKMLELSVYDDIPHLLSPVVTEPAKAIVALKWAVKEMENRYRLMSNLGVRNVNNYNKRLSEARASGEELTRTVQTGFDPETGKPIMEKQPLDMTPLPFIVIVVDEMADLMLVAGKDIEASIQRLAQMARAAGIHLIMATQRPSVDVITGVIKANFPTRISFQVTSKIDSRTILGEQGAEQLLGQGDMLYMSGGGRIGRVHGPFISDKEVEDIVTYLHTQGSPIYEEAVTHDEEAGAGDFGAVGGDDGESDADRALYQQAVEIVVRDGKASTSYIQRKLKIGYNRAARIIEKMEEDGVVGPANHVGKREVLMR